MRPRDCRLQTPSFRLMQWPGHRMSRESSHRLVGIGIGGIRRLGELVLQLCADWRVEVQSLGRNFLRDPLVIQLLTFATLINRRGCAIDHLFEGWIVLAQ